MGVVTTKQIMIELCKETGEPGAANNQTIFGCLLDGIRSLSLHNLPTWDTIKGLTLNEYNAICWPNAVVKPLITYLMRDGKPFALDVDDSILSTVATNANTFGEADQEIKDYYRLDGFGPYWGTYSWALGEVYGVGAGYRKIGVVTHDDKRRQSFIKGVTLRSDDTFGMFFKGDGLSDENMPLMVPSEAKDAIEEYALQKYYRVRNPGLAAAARVRYKEAITELNKFTSDDGVIGWIEAIRSNVMSAPKL